MKRRYRVKAAYLFLWMLIFIIPVAFVVFGNSGNIGDFRGMAHTFMFVWSLVVVFFFNYTFLIDQYLYSQRSKYVIFNIVLVGLLALIMFAWEKMDFDIMNGFVAPDMNVPRRGYMFHPRMGGGGGDIFRPVPPFRHNLPLFIMGKILPLMLMIGMAIAIKAIYRLNKAEREVKELERSRTEAELKNLRNQLNPHFLFNTLNNIYALIDISPDKARLSILQLSDMMRHVLYNDKSRYIQLSKELRFIEDYVSLMKLRMNDNLEITVDLPKDSEGVMVAPLMFISLVENAFKHGVSTTKPSFLTIDIKLNEQGIICKVENSYFPKGKEDNSGSGIGISNLRKRLDLIYGSVYVYNTEHDDKKYVAILILPVKRTEEQS